MNRSSSGKAHWLMTHAYIYIYIHTHKYTLNINPFSLGFKALLSSYTAVTIVPTNTTDPSDQVIACSD